VTLPYIFDDPVHTKEYDMESAIMRLTGFDQLGYPRRPQPEFVHPEHTTPFVNDCNIKLPIPTIHKPLPPEPDLPKRSYCTCTGVRDIAFEHREYYQDAMICLGCGKVIRKNKSK